MGFAARCPIGDGVMFGQEAKPIPTIPASERAPNSLELRLWARAEKACEKTAPLAYALELQYFNILITAKFAASGGVPLALDEMKTLEPQMQTALIENERLKQAMADVRNLKLGIRVTPDRTDLEILQPPSLAFSGWVIPVTIGALVVAAIISRWIWVENEFKRISDRYNHILTTSDEKLCADPNSKLCADWNTTKAQSGYQKNETVIDSIKGAVKGIGGALGRGLGSGIMLAIVLGMLIYLPAPKRSK